ncbi:6-phosphogluconate dehydrogenase C-terminal domain-like protein [Dentipellis sp. KUC8613]|nr:6-phosphogluconate dehydrogenase C-terminal domain-like protein [Dentipellis sp. KUC8613]
MIDVCVVGLGAIGAFYAFVLEHSGRARVTAVCRSNYNILSEDGIDILAEKIGRYPSWKPYRVFRTASEAADRQYDLIICAFKALPDVTTTPEILQPLLHNTDTFVLIQNGIDIHRDLRKARPDADIISCCAWIDATPLNGGKAVEQTGPDKLSSGLHTDASPSKPSEERGRKALQTFHDILIAGGAGSEIVDNIDAARWRKVLWNVTFSTLCTVLRVPVADLLSKRVLANVLPTIRGMMSEVITVARSLGIEEAQLPEQAAEAVIQSCMNLYSDERNENPSRFKPSMLVDLEADRPMEIEPIVGAIIRSAAEHGVATPRLDTVYAQLKVLQEQLIQRRNT